jgi:hypothetical protein
VCVCPNCVLHSKTSDRLVHYCTECSCEFPTIWLGDPGKCLRCQRPNPVWRCQVVDALHHWWRPGMPRSYVVG